MAKQHRRHYSQDMTARNPVSKAIHIRRLQQHTVTEQIDVMLAADGEEATKLLADLGWKLGVATLTAVNVYGVNDGRSRRLHGALRTVHQLCLEGYLWRSAFAHALDDAIAEATTVMVEHPQWAQAAIPHGNVFAGLIQQHRVLPDTIAGAELYSQQPQETASI